MVSVTSVKPLPLRGSVLWDLEMHFLLLHVGVWAEGKEIARAEIVC